MTSALFFEVADVRVTRRRVEIPERCPNAKCGRSLREVGAVVATELMPVWYRGCSIPEGGDPGAVEYGDSGFDWDGGGNVLGVSLSCACGQDLAVGRLVEDDGSDVCRRGGALVTTPMGGSAVHEIHTFFFVNAASSIHAEREAQRLAATIGGTVVRCWTASQGGCAAGAEIVGARSDIPLPDGWWFGW